MAGIGDSWGTREELLHPRDAKGRFRSKWKLSERAFQAVIGALEPFSPHTFQSQSQATQYAVNLGHSKPGRFQGGKGNARLIQDWFNANNDLLDGIPDEPSTQKFVKMMDDSMIETPEDMITGMVVGPDAFGLTPDRIGEMENMKNVVIANRGYTAASVGNPPAAGGPGQIRISMATPAKTRMAFPATAQSDNSAIFDRDQEFTITKVEPDGQGGFNVWAVATPKTPEDNLPPIGGKAGPGNSGDREADIKAIEDIRMKRDMGEQGASQLPGGQAAGGMPEDEQGRVKRNAPGEGGAGPDPASERAARRAQILGRPVSGQGKQSQAPADQPVPATDSGPAPNGVGGPAPEAPNVTPAPSGVQPPNGATSTATGEPQASFRDKINDANLEAPSKAARKDFNDAVSGIESGKRNPADVERDLKADIADLKRKAGQEGTDTEQLNADADKLQKLADVIGDHFQTPGRSRTTGEAVDIQSAEKPAIKAPKDAPARGPKSQMTAGEKSDFEKKIDARLATKAPSKKPAATPPRPPSEAEIRAEKQKALLNDTGARPAASKKVNPKKIGVKAPEGNQLQRDMEDDRLNAEQRTQWSNELGPEPAILKKQAGNILLDEVADLLRNGRITKPKAAARLRDQAREDDDAGADYLRRAADLIESDTSKAKKRVPLKPKRGVVPDEAEASLEGRTERNILTGLNQLDVGNLRGLADKWGIETRGEDKKLKTKPVLAKELAAHWKATPSLQKKGPEAAAVDELDELLLPQLKERAKAEGIKLNSKMRKAEILAALKLKRDGDAVVDMTPTPAKKVAKKAAAKKLPPGGMTPEEFAEASPRILAGENVDAVGRDILGRRGAAAELDLPIEGGPDIADADAVKARLQEIGDTGNNADAVAYLDGLKLSAKDLRLLANDMGVGDIIGAKDTKAQVRDKLINVFATGRQNQRAIKRAMERERDKNDLLVPELAAPKTPEARDLAAVAEAPEVPKPIAKAAAKAAKAADKIADTADEVSEMYDPKVGTADLKTIDDLSTEDRIAVSMLNSNNGKNRTKILLMMTEKHPEEAKRVLKAEQIMAQAEAERHGPLTPEDRLSVELLRLAGNQPGLRESILRENPDHRDRILNAEKLVKAEEAGEAPAVPTPAPKKAAKKVTAKVMDEVVQEAKEKVATTKGPAKVSTWDRVTAHVMKRIGEIDPDMRERVMEEMAPKDRDTLLDIEHRVELQRTQVKKGGGDLDKIMTDAGIAEPGDRSPSRVTFERAQQAIARGFPAEAIKELKQHQKESKQEQEMSRRSAADPQLSPATRQVAVRNQIMAQERADWAARMLQTLEGTPEVDTKPGPLVKKAVENVVISLPETERASWNSATVDGIRKAAATGGIELPDGITTKEEALQEVIKELARRKLAGEELPTFEAPEAPRVPEPTLPKASTNIKGDTVEGHSYREAVRLLESGDYTPAEAAKRMRDTARSFRESAQAVNNNGWAAPEARIASRDRLLDVARQYDEAATELRARKRVPKPAVVAEVLKEATAEVVPKAPLAQRLREAGSAGEAAALLDLGRNKKPYLDLATALGLPERKNRTIAQLKQDILTVASARRTDAAMGRAINAPVGGPVGETLTRAGRGVSVPTPSADAPQRDIVEALTTTPAPAKKAAQGIPAATKERLATAAKKAAPGIPATTKERLATAAKKAAPSVEAQVETRMDVAKATKAAAPAAPASVGGITRQELMDEGPGGLKQREDDLGIVRPSLDRGARADAILAKMAENAASPR